MRLSVVPENDGHILHRLVVEDAVRWHSQRYVRSGDRGKAVPADPGEGHGEGDENVIGTQTG